MSFYTILTEIGEAKLANATALGTSLSLTHIAVGDGNGVAITPYQTDAALRNEVWRGVLNSISIDPDNANWIIAEGYIPSTDGGFTVREVALFDAAGDMIAIGGYPDTYKPTLASGSAKDLYIKIIIEVSNTGTVELKIDPAVVLASRKWVDDNFHNIINPTSYKNKIVNSDFSIWQRGDAFLSDLNEYTADRWIKEATCSVTRMSTRYDTSTLNGKYTARVAINNLETLARFEQRIEDGSRIFQNKTVTVSFDAISNVLGKDLNVVFADETSINVVSKSVNLGSVNFKRHSVTLIVPDAFAANHYKFLRFDMLGAATDYFEVGNVQLEEGPSATPYEQPPIGIDMDLCQRRALVLNNSMQATVYPASRDAANSIIFTVPVPTTFASLPSATISGSFLLRGEGVEESLTNATVVSYNDSAVTLVATGLVHDPLASGAYSVIATLGSKIVLNGEL